MVAGFRNARPGRADSLSEVGSGESKQRMARNLEPITTRDTLEIGVELFDPLQLKRHAALLTDPSKLLEVILYDHHSGSRRRSRIVGPRTLTRE
jgi:hypothetical protein